MRDQKIWILIGLIVVLSAAACSKGEEPATAAPSASGGPDANGAEIRIAVVSHGQASDPFWSVVKNGITRAAKEMGVTVTYNAPQTFDMVAMSRFIDAEVAKKPDGLVVTIPDASALSGSIKAAVAAGIPVISMNSGSDAYKELGVLAHIGQTEYEAGFGAGEKMAAAGVKSALCINHEVGNTGIDLRCKGYSDALGKTGATSRVLAVNANDPTDSQQKVLAATGSGGIDGLLACGPLSARPALAALKQSDKLGKIKLGTFDLTPEVLEAIKAGDIEFAIDQQQYLQGYLPIVFLTQYKRFGVLPSGGVIATGPGFVTKSTAARVIELARQGLR